MTSKQFSSQSLQDNFLNKAQNENKVLTFYLVNGLPLKGKIQSFDNFTIQIEMEQNQKLCLIYKHAIATVVLS